MRDLATQMFFSRLCESDRNALFDRCSAAQRYPPGRDFLTFAEPSRGTCAIRSGIACRYVTLSNGQRQILGYSMPGDFVDLRACYADRIDFSAAALSEIEIVTLPRRDLLELVESRPELARDLLRLSAVEDAIARQWLLNVGHRNALERVAHLLCECFARLTAAGVADGNGYSLPITQTDMADALALSPVHVNRTLMTLRRRGLILVSGRRITIPNLTDLQDIAGFDPHYLDITPLGGAPQLAGHFPRLQQARAGSSIPPPGA